MNILIRADGSTTLGMGHLYRCLAMIQMLDSKYDITFVCREITGDFEYILTKNNYKLIQISNELEFLDLCDEKKIVVIDGHHFPSELYQKVREKGSQIVCIDDLHDKNYHSDVIINQAPGITSTDYSTDPFNYFALGPNYALLREPFLKAANNKRKITSIKSCFICFGGGDQLDLTLRTLKIAIQFPAFKTINVVTGSAYKHSESLKAFAGNESRIKLFHAIDENQMAEIISASDLAIVPCSTILLEIFAAGCIPISGYFVENQKYFYQNFLKQNAFIDAVNFSETAIENALNNALNSDINITEIIDGKSKSGIKKCFQLLENIASIELTTAKPEDTEITYKWASDPEVRKWSFNTNPIVFEKHKNWFSEKVKDTNCIYFIARMNNESIGSIRFDLEDNKAIISYLLDPAFHGRGLGQALLIKGCKTFSVLNFKENQLSEIIGYVSKENFASRKVFENIGFVKTVEPDKLKYSINI
jgi:UDP-2,4-diacetamido-2,4,6-trideoxy-beta-L-altropyranose hydrolase